MNEAHDHFGGGTGPGGQLQNRSIQKGSCSTCGRPIKREATAGEPWKRVLQKGDRVLAPHPNDAVSRELYPATVTETGTHESPTGDEDTVTVEFDQSELFGQGDVATVVADGVEPLASDA